MDALKELIAMQKLIALLLASLILAGTTVCHAEEAQETSATPTASVKTVSADQVEMDYVVFGSGAKSFVIIPGLSIHSVMGSADAIAAAYQSFTDAYTVYVFDRPKNIQTNYSIRDLAEDTAVAMKALGIEKADIFGASQGGMIAQYLAIDHPELVHAMILGSTLCTYNDTFLSVLDEWVSLAEAKDETALLESFADHVYSKATLDAYRDYLISSNRGITDEEYARFIILAEACERFDCTDEIHNITCPVLVLGSQGDQVTTASGAQDLAARLECELFLYPDTYGHSVYDEAADYKDRCLQFLQKYDDQEPTSNLDVLDVSDDDEEE